MPRGHFAHPGLSDGWTGYCVLGWFLYDVPGPGLQTPFITARFVSPGAGSPFAPLAYFAALCTHIRDQGICNENRVKCNSKVKRCWRLHALWLGPIIQVVCGPSTTTPFLSKPLQAPEIIYIDCLKSGFRQLKRCICCCTYLHTPWCHPAGQSLQGTYQSNALCVGKSPTCTWCRSLCWNRTHSSLSCTLEGGGERRRKTHQGWSDSVIWSWLKAEGFGERWFLKGLLYIVSPTTKVSAAQVIALSSSCCCLEWVTQQCSKAQQFELKQNCDTKMDRWGFKELQGLLFAPKQNKRCGACS